MWLDPRRYEVIDEQMAEVLRAKTGTQRLKMIDGLWRMARRLVRSQVRATHPDWNTAQIDQETARRMSRGAV